MTIRFYPSRLPGKPLETHEHGVTSIRSWLVANVEDYEDRDVPPLAIELDGQPVPLANGRFASSGRKAMSACTRFLSGLK